MTSRMRVCCVKLAERQRPARPRDSAPRPMLASAVLVVAVLLTPASAGAPRAVADDQAVFHLHLLGHDIGRETVTLTRDGD